MHHRPETIAYRSYRSGRRGNFFRMRGIFCLQPHSEQAETKSRKDGGSRVIGVVGPPPVLGQPFDKRVAVAVPAVSTGDCTNEHRVAGKKQCDRDDPDAGTEAQTRADQGSEEGTEDRMDLSGNSVGLELASRSSRHGVVSEISRTGSAKRFPEFNDAADEWFSELIATVAADQNAEHNRVTREEKTQLHTPSEPHAHR